MKDMTETKSGPSWKAMGIVFVIFCVVISLCIVVKIRVNYETHTVWCGNSQRQIVGACIAYAQHEGGFWPMPWPNPEAYPKPISVDAQSAHVVAVRCLETFAQVYKLPNGLFAYACSPVRAPNSYPEAVKDIAGLWGVGPTNAVSFAFDWSISGDRGGVAIVLADRDPSNHFGKPNVCFGDSHVKAIKFTSQTTRTLFFPNKSPTEGSDGKFVEPIWAKPGDVVTAAAPTHALFDPGQSQSVTVSLDGGSSATTSGERQPDDG
jgi:hypothetical protein